MDFNSSHSTPCSSGRITLPVEEGHEAAVRDLIGRWGADALRNSDGTEYSEELKQLDLVKYTTFCPARTDQDFLACHSDVLQHNALMSEPVTAEKSNVSLPLMKGYFRDQLRLDVRPESQADWQVFDRTAGREIARDHWTFNEATESVQVREATPFHRYTVNFWAWHIWDSTSMYNHLSNKWDRPHQRPQNPMVPKCREHLLGQVDRWCAGHPETDVVRLTSLFYHFTNIYHDGKGEKLTDYFGYNDAASPLAFDLFEQDRGYRLTLEDLIDEGYYNCYHRSPGKAYLDFMDFITGWVMNFTRELTDIIHRHGKKAMLFTSDHWIGAELYDERIHQSGIDMLVTACHNGTMLRRTGDCPLPVEKEIRLQPYFFPNEFDQNGVPIEETLENWARARRAMLRCPVDRAGFGGYISLPYRYPEYVDLIAVVCHEFRTIADVAEGDRPLVLPGQVAVLNAWGSLRCWQAQPFWYEKFYRENFMECLAGLPFEVVFLSFEEVAKWGVPEEVRVILHGGPGGTAWSGGDVWRNPNLVAQLREWVFEGGGMVGVDCPSFCPGQGASFQLADVFGLDREVGFSANAKPTRTHRGDYSHLTDGVPPGFAFPGSKSAVFATSPHLQVARERQGHIDLAGHYYGAGRAVYLSDLYYSPEESRLLMNCLNWAGWGSCHPEGLPRTDCPAVEIAVFPSSGIHFLANSSSEDQRGVWWDAGGGEHPYDIAAFGLLQSNPVKTNQEARHISGDLLQGA